MKISYLLAILLLFSAVNSVGYVYLYPGATFYGGDMTVTFSNSDGINTTYLEVGETYANFGELNLSITCSGSIAINFSQCREGDFLSSDESIMRFNATFSGSVVTFTFTRDNTTNVTYSLYTDSVLTNTYTSNSFTFINYDWSTHDFDIRGDFYPDPPYNPDCVYTAALSTINLTWDRGDYSDIDVLRMKTTGYPSSPTDGTLIQSSTTPYYNFTISGDQYYTIWSLNTTSGLYSKTGLDLPWGAISLSIYNESNPSQAVSPWGLIVSSSDGTTTYTVSSATNPHDIDFADIPFGENTVFVINSTGYISRTYYKDIYQNNLYDWAFYLPPFETETDPGGGDDGGTSDDFITTQNYVIQVVDEISNPIQGAKVVIRTYINTTDRYETIASLLTDGYGQTEAVALIPQTLYKVNISATGFQTLNGQNFRPVYIEYDTDRYKTFTLTATETDFENETSYEEDILFNGHLVNANNTICINYTDRSAGTTDTTIHVFVTNHTTNLTTLLQTDSRTGDNSFQVWISINTSNTFTAYLNLNHSVYGYVHDSVIIPGHPWTREDEDLSTTTTTEFDTLFDNILGSNPFGWSALFGVFILLAGLFAFGQRNVGLSLFITGFVMLGFNAVLGLDMLSSSICIVIIILGILLQWKISRRLSEG